jgi:type II secretory pathway component PulF
MTETIFSILIGIGLAASVGFRVFVPLFILSISAHFGIIPLNESWAWVGSNTAMITLGIATILEVFAYLIPWFDNLLDSITLPLATIAGTAVMVSTIAGIDPVFTWALAIIAGGGTATAVKASTSSARLTSTGTTGGVANPILSTIETGTSIGMSLLSVFIPVLAIIVLLIIFWIFYKFFNLFRRKPKKSA